MPSRHEHKILSMSNREFEDSFGVEFLRHGLSLLVQLFIELELSNQIEAAPHERNQTRRSHRNGYRRRTWTTSVGEIVIEIPKLRKGTYYPAFFDELRQSESFMLDLLRETYRHGVNLARIQSIVAHLGLPTNDNANISFTVEQLYDLVDRFRDKPRSRHVSNSRPVNAIATVLLDAHIDADETLPQSFYQQMPADWLADSLNVLARLRQALSNQTDAIAA